MMPFGCISICLNSLHFLGQHHLPNSPSSYLKCWHHGLISVKIKTIFDVIVIQIRFLFQNGNLQFLHRYPTLDLACCFASTLAHFWGLLFYFTLLSTFMMNLLLALEFIRISWSSSSQASGTSRPQCSILMTRSQSLMVQSQEPNLQVCFSPTSYQDFTIWRKRDLIDATCVAFGHIYLIIPYPAKLCFLNWFN